VHGQARERSGSHQFAAPGRRTRRTRRNLPQRLSGGQQCAALDRALATSPRPTLLYEPQATSRESRRTPLPSWCARDQGLGPLWPRDDKAELIKHHAVAPDHEPVGLALVGAEAASCECARPTVQGQAERTICLKLSDQSLRACFESLAVRGEELNYIRPDAPATSQSPDCLDKIYSTSGLARTCPNEAIASARAILRTFWHPVSPARGA
jgi:hypothetical protein